MAKVSSSKSLEARVPKLRFRDDNCNDYPQYQHETVGALFAHISQRNTDMTNNNVITNSAEFGLIPQREFFDKDIAVEGNTDKYFIIEQGDFVYNPRKSSTAPYGPFNCYQGKEKGIVSPLYTCLKPLHKEYTDYLLWYFRASAWYSYIYHNGAQGGARHDRVGMTNQLMDGIPVNLPCLDEQLKVSRFLSTLDSRIGKQRQLVEALKLYKRGLLNRLFNGGCDLSWHTINLGEMCSITMGQSPDSASYNIDKIWLPLVQGNADITDGVTTPHRYTTSPTKTCESGAVILSVRAPVGSVSRANQKICLGRGVCAITSQNTEFIYQLLIYHQDTWKRIEQGGTFTAISSDNISSFAVSVPNIETQNYISSLLSKYDSKVRNEETILRVLQNQKAALLQSLFI